MQSFHCLSLCQLSVIGHKHNVILLHIHVLLKAQIIVAGKDLYTNVFGFGRVCGTSIKSGVTSNKSPGLNSSTFFGDELLIESCYIFSSGAGTREVCTHSQSLTETQSLLQLSDRGEFP